MGKDGWDRDGCRGTIGPVKGCYSKVEGEKCLDFVCLCHGPSSFCVLPSMFYRGAVSFLFLSSGNSVI